MSRLPLAPSLAVAIAVGAGAALSVSDAAHAAGRLLDVSTLNEQRVVLVSDTSARAFDRIQAARRALDAGRGFDAAQQLTHARSLIAQARSASPALGIQQQIDAMLVRLDDPTKTAPRAILDPIFSALEGAGDAKAFGPARLYLERARYELYRGDHDAAIHELASASARIPYSRIDAPLGVIAEQVNRALIQIYEGRLDLADATVARAERHTHGVVRLASGLDAEFLNDVAAPPASAPKPAPALAPAADEQATESDIPTAPWFLETTDPPLSDGEAPPPRE